MATALGLGLALAVPHLAGSPRALAGEIAPASSAPASGQDESLLKSVLKSANMATDEIGHPQDFVVKSRPAAPSDYVPIYRPTEEHKTKVLTPDQVKAIETELGATGAHDGRIRDAFPPARRAHQQEERDKAAKAAAKKSKAAAKVQ